MIGVDGDLPRQRRLPLEHRLRLARQAEVPVRRHRHAVRVEGEPVPVHGEVALTRRDLEDRRALVDLIELGKPDGIHVGIGDVPVRLAPQEVAPESRDGVDRRDGVYRPLPLLEVVPAEPCPHCREVQHLPGRAVLCVFLTSS